MEPKRSYRAFREEVPEEPEVGEIGKADILQEGDDLTVISFGAMMRTTQPAVEKVQQERGVKIELIDLLTISPMDTQAIEKSVSKTGRCVIVQEAPRTLGIASEIVARINDAVLMSLEAPVNRVTGYDVVTPYFGREGAYMPTSGRVQRAIEQTLDF